VKNYRSVFTALLCVLAVFSNVSAEAAERVLDTLENGGYIIKTNDNGDFWIEDNVHQMTQPLKIESRPTGRSGAYELICGTKTRVVVTSVGLTISEITKLLSPVPAIPVVTKIGTVIYNAMCEIWK
jgi:hypothetical protein